MTDLCDLDLPALDTGGLDRAEALAAVTALARYHRLVRTEMGVAVLHHADVAAILRERRFHNALSLLRR